MASAEVKLEEEEVRPEDTYMRDAGIIYSVEDNPPWYLSLLLGFQVSLYSLLWSSPSPPHYIQNN